MNKLPAPKDIVRAGLCIGCGSCVAQANSPAIKMEFDVFGQLKPTGDKEWYSKGTENFSATCPFSAEAKNEDQLAEELFPAAAQYNTALGRFESAYVGHVQEQDFREQGSSGGMVTWVAAELLRRGFIDGVVNVVAASDPEKENRFFHYQIAHNEAEVRAGAKSRYYPIELSESA